MDNSEHSRGDQRSNQCGADDSDSEVSPRSNDGSAPKVFDGIFAALELLALVFWILSETLHKNWILHSALLSLALSLFVVGAVHALGNLWKRRLIVWSIASVVIATCCFLVFATAKPEPQRKPHLRLMLNTSSSMFARLMLTNDFLIYTGRKSPAGFSPGWLIIPVPMDEDVTELHFALVNDSALGTSDDAMLAVEGAVVDFVFGEQPGPGYNLPWSLAPGWGNVPTRNEAETHLRFHFDRTILPGAGDGLPSIAFKNQKAPAKKILMQFQFRAKGVAPLELAFFLLFIPSDDLRPPFILAPSNDVTVVEIKRVNIVGTNNPPKNRPQ